MTKKINIEELKARISYEEFYDLYITQNKNKQHIRKVFDLSDREFRKLAKIYNTNKSEKLKNNKFEYANIITREEIYNLYITQNKSKEYLCKKLNITDHKFRQILKVYNIDKSKILNRGIKDIDKDILYQYYIVENKEAAEIQKIFNMTEKNFFDLLHKYNISKMKYNFEENKKLSEKIKILYIDQNLSQKEVCKRLGISLGKLLVIRDQFNLIKPQEQIEKVKEKTYKEKYGVNRPTQLTKIADKAWATKKARGTTNTSKPEDNAYAMLRAKFPQTLRNHATSQYPFHCDFYIPELDLYIEYQGDPSHGKEPYDASNPKHQQILKTWQQKAQKIEEEAGKQSRYSSFIDTWTRRDPLKRQTAAANHLNWLEFFTFGAFLDWFNALP